MCGISGIILTKGIVNKENILQSNKLMYHRGPDASSFWLADSNKIGFGHVRLSIVDLNNRSNQPFQIDNGDYVMVFNGEIYNYKKLRELLIEKFNVIFNTKSDTEILIYMYKHFGKECLDYIEGMFAFSIYDRINNTVFIARDFVGQKPLVYISDDSGFYFASEIPALFELYPDFKKEVDENVIKLYLLGNFWHIPNNFCIFKNIKKLNFASYIIIKDGKILNEGIYDKLNKKTSIGGNEVDFLDNTLTEMKPSDIGYASFLSGGIDSSFVCNGLKQSEITKTDSYTLTIGKDDEDLERSKFLAEKLELNHKIINLDNFDFLKSIDDTIGILGEPYFHITSIFADSILQKAKEKHKVFFTGAGGDECYYGYNNILFILMDFYFKIKILLPNFLINLINKITNNKYKDILYSDIKSFKSNYYKSGYNKISGLFNNKNNIDVYIDKLVKDFFNFVDTSSYIDASYMFGLFIENMHSLTIQGDIIGMKNSIEIRSLFLERRVIKRSYSISLMRKISIFRLNEGKEILRKQLIKIFGRKFVYSKKIGFGVKYDFREIIKKKYLDLLKSKIDKLVKRGIFDKNEIENLFTNFQGNFQIILKLYAIEIWFEKFIDNTNKNVE